MATLSEVFNAATDAIQSQFPNTRFEFVAKEFHDRHEVWVHFVDKSVIARVKAFCRKLELPPQPRVVVRVKSWSGHWPSDTLDEVELRRRRDEFVERAKQQKARKIAQHH